MEEHGTEEVTLTFRAPPPRERVQRYLYDLLGARGVIFLLLALSPGATLLGLGANAPFPAWALGIGVGLFAFGVGAGALGALVAPPPDTVIELDPAGVREKVRGKVLDRGWAWIERADESEHAFTIQVRAEPMKSLRLDVPRPRIFVVDKRSTPDAIIALLQRLLAQR